MGKDIVHIKEIFENIIYSYIVHIKKHIKFDKRIRLLCTSILLVNVKHVIHQSKKKIQIKDYITRLI